jgi:hypothetical protein
MILFLEMAHPFQSYILRRAGLDIHFDWRIIAQYGDFGRESNDGN